MSEASVERLRLLLADNCPDARPCAHSWEGHPYGSGHANQAKMMNVVPVHPTPGYLAFEDMQVKGRKTKVWLVRSRHGNELGQIEWHNSWRQYVFSPYSYRIFSAGCMAAIIEFIDDRMAERKKAA